MVAGGQVSIEKYRRSTKAQKITYWCFVGTVASFTIYVWFFYEPPKKESERRSAQTQSSSSASAVKK